MLFWPVAIFCIIYALNDNIFIGNLGKMLSVVSRIKQKYSFYSDMFRIVTPPQHFSEPYIKCMEENKAWKKMYNPVHQFGICWNKRTHLTINTTTTSSLRTSFKPEQLQRFTQWHTGSYYWTTQLLTGWAHENKHAESNSFPKQQHQHFLKSRFWFVHFTEFRA